VCGGGDQDETDLIIFCALCDVVVHQGCYGIAEVPAGEWYCDSCIEIINWRLDIEAKSRNDPALLEYASYRIPACRLCHPSAHARIRARDIWLPKSLADDLRQGTKSPADVNAEDVKVRYQPPPELAAPTSVVREPQNLLESLIPPAWVYPQAPRLLNTIERLHDDDAEEEKFGSSFGGYNAGADPKTEPGVAETPVVPRSWGRLLGALKPTDLATSSSSVAKSSLSKWVHCLDALWIPELYFGDPAKLSPICGLSGLDPARCELKCIVCGEQGSGGCIQCQASKQCRKAFHPHCARMGGLELVSGDSPEHDVAACLQHCRSKAKAKGGHTMTHSLKLKRLDNSKVETVDFPFSPAQAAYWVSSSSLASEIRRTLSLATQFCPLSFIKESVGDEEDIVWQEMPSSSSVDPVREASKYYSYKGCQQTTQPVTGLSMLQRPLEAAASPIHIEQDEMLSIVRDSTSANVPEFPIYLTADTQKGKKRLILKCTPSLVVRANHSDKTTRRSRHSVLLGDSGSEGESPELSDDHNDDDDEATLTKSSDFESDEETDSSESSESEASVRVGRKSVPQHPISMPLISGEPQKRKRGRPRKYPLEQTVAPYKSSLPHNVTAPSTQIGQSSRSRGRASHSHLADALEAAFRTFTQSAGFISESNTPVAIPVYEIESAVNIGAVPAEILVYASTLGEIAPSSRGAHINEDFTTYQEARAWMIDRLGKSIAGALAPLESGNGHDIQIQGLFESVILGGQPTLGFVRTSDHSSAGEFLRSTEDTLSTPQAQRGMHKQPTLGTPTRSPGRAPASARKIEDDDKVSNGVDLAKASTITATTYEGIDGLNPLEIKTPQEFWQKLDREYFEASPKDLITLLPKVTRRTLSHTGWGETKCEWVEEMMKAETMNEPILPDPLAQDPIDAASNESSSHFTGQLVYELEGTTAIDRASVYPPISVDVLWASARDVHAVNQALGVPMPTGTHTSPVPGALVAFHPPAPARSHLLRYYFPSIVASYLPPSNIQKRSIAIMRKYVIGEATAMHETAPSNQSKQLLVPQLAGISFAGSDEDAGRAVIEGVEDTLELVTSLTHELEFIRSRRSRRSDLQQDSSNPPVHGLPLPVKRLSFHRTSLGRLARLLGRGSGGSTPKFDEQQGISGTASMPDPAGETPMEEYHEADSLEASDDEAYQSEASSVAQCDTSELVTPSRQHSAEALSKTIVPIASWTPSRDLTVIGQDDMDEITAELVALRSVYSQVRMCNLLRRQNLEKAIMNASSVEEERKTHAATWAATLEEYNKYRAQQRNRLWRQHKRAAMTNIRKLTSTVSIADAAEILTSIKSTDTSGKQEEADQSKSLLPNISASAAAASGCSLPPMRDDGSLLARVIKDGVCAICGEPDSEEGNDIICCDGCHVAVHQECYGVPVVPDGEWYCSRCEQGVSPRVICCVCHQAYGAMKPVQVPIPAEAVAKHGSSIFVRQPAISQAVQAIGDPRLTRTHFLQYKGVEAVKAPPIDPNYGTIESRTRVVPHKVCGIPNPDAALMAEEALARAGMPRVGHAPTGDVLIAPQSSPSFWHGLLKYMTEGPITYHSVLEFTALAGRELTRMRILRERRTSRSSHEGQESDHENEDAADSEVDQAIAMEQAVNAYPDPPGLWAHVVCATWTPELYFVDADKVDPVAWQGVVSTFTTAGLRRKLNCYICRMNKCRGAVIQCQEPRCTESFHPQCARQTGLAELGMIRVGNALKHAAYCDKHRRDTDPTHVTPEQLLLGQGLREPPADLLAQLRKAYLGKKTSESTVQTSSNATSRPSILSIVRLASIGKLTADMLPLPILAELRRLVLSRAAKRPALRLQADDLQVTLKSWSWSIANSLPAFQAPKRCSACAQPGLGPGPYIEALLGVSMLRVSSVPRRRHVSSSTVWAGLDDENMITIPLKKSGRGTSVEPGLQAASSEEVMARPDAESNSMLDESPEWLVWLAELITGKADINMPLPGESYVYNEEPTEDDENAMTDASAGTLSSNPSETNLVTMDISEDNVKEPLVEYDSSDWRSVGMWFNRFCNTAYFTKRDRREKSETPSLPPNPSLALPQPPSLSDLNPVVGCISCSAFAHADCVGLCSEDWAPCLATFIRAIARAYRVRMGQFGTTKQRKEVSQSSDDTLRFCPETLRRSLFDALAIIYDPSIVTPAHPGFCPVHTWVPSDPEGYFAQLDSRRDGGVLDPNAACTCDGMHLVHSAGNNASASEAESPSETQKKELVERANAFTPTAVAGLSEYVCGRCGELAASVPTAFENSAVLPYFTLEELDRLPKCVLCGMGHGAFKPVQIDPLLVVQQGPKGSVPAPTQQQDHPSQSSKPGASSKNAVEARQWVHIICAQHVPEVYFTGTPPTEEVCGVDSALAARRTLVCSLCHTKGGAPIQCCHRLCYNAFHVYCAAQAGLWNPPPTPGADVSEDQHKQMKDANPASGHRTFCVKHALLADPNPDRQTLLDKLSHELTLRRKLADTTRMRSTFKIASGATWTLDELRTLPSSSSHSVDHSQHGAEPERRKSSSTGAPRGRPRIHDRDSKDRGRNSTSRADSKGLLGSKRGRSDSYGGAKSEESQGSDSMVLNAPLGGIIPRLMLPSKTINNTTVDYRDWVNELSSLILPTVELPQSPGSDATSASDDKGAFKSFKDWRVEKRGPVNPFEIMMRKANPNLKSTSGNTKDGAQSDTLPPPLPSPELDAEQDAIDSEDRPVKRVCGVASEVKRDSSNPRIVDPWTTVQRHAIAWRKASRRVDQRAGVYAPPDAESYCFCDTAYDDGFMIQCEHCLTWCHGACVGLVEEKDIEAASSQSTWLCPICIIRHGSQYEAGAKE